MYVLFAIVYTRILLCDVLTVRVSGKWCLFLNKEKLVTFICALSMFAAVIDACHCVKDIHYRLFFTGVGHVKLFILRNTC